MKRVYYFCTQIGIDLCLICGDNEGRLFKIKVQKPKNKKAKNNQNKFLKKQTKNVFSKTNF